jgi:hypothetical protein
MSSDSVKLPSFPASIQFSTGTGGNPSGGVASTVGTFGIGQGGFTSSSGGGSSASTPGLSLKPPRTVAELGEFADSLMAVIRACLGPRSTAVVMLGRPIENEDHDRFVARVGGPCLSSRGLLAWGERAVREKIDAEDTSRNGKPHP